MARHYYAEFHLFDNLPDGDALQDKLMRFESREERDDMVERINYAHMCESTRAVTLADVSHKYNVQDFYNGDKFTEGYPRTCHNKIYIEIAPKH